MARKRNFFDIENIVTGLKGSVSGILSALTIIPLYVLVSWLFATKAMFGLGLIFSIFTVLLNWHFWGFYSNRLWGWK